MGLQGYPRGLPVTISPFNPLMNLNCSKRQMGRKRSKHVVVLLGGNKRSHCTAPLSSSGALVESLSLLFEQKLNRSRNENWLHHHPTARLVSVNTLRLHEKLFTDNNMGSLSFTSQQTHPSKVNSMAIWEDRLWWKKAGWCKVRTRDQTDTAAWTAANNLF